jgi:predicted dehydrogenase
VRGILSSTPDRARQAAAAFGLPCAYESLEQLAGDSEVRAVHLCTPNHLHFAAAGRLLRAGKHVLSEKPLALDSQESGMLVELACETNLVGAVAYNLRYYPLCQEVRARIASGQIGEPRLVHGSFLQDWLLRPEDWNWRLDPRQGGELRAVSDIGTHWLDLVSWATGCKVREVCADLATVVPVRRRPRGHVETFKSAASGDFEEIPVTTEDYASVLLGLEKGLRGAMTVSQVSAGRKARLWFEIDGSESSLAWDSESPNTLWIGRRSEPIQELLKDPSLLSDTARPFAAYPGGHAEGYPDTFVQLFRQFYDYLDAANFSAPRPFPTFETGHEALLVSEAIAKSAAGRRWVSVEPG